MYLANVQILIRAIIASSSVLKSRCPVDIVMQGSDISLDFPKDGAFKLGSTVLTRMPSQAADVISREAILRLEHSEKISKVAIAEATLDRVQPRSYQSCRWKRPGKINDSYCCSCCYVCNFIISSKWMRGMDVELLGVFPKVELGIQSTAAAWLRSRSKSGRLRGWNQGCLGLSTLLKLAEQHKMA